MTANIVDIAAAGRENPIFVDIPALTEEFTIRTGVTKSYKLITIAWLTQEALLVLFYIRSDKVLLRVPRSVAPLYTSITHAFFPSELTEITAFHRD